MFFYRICYLCYMPSFHKIHNQTNLTRMKKVKSWSLREQLESANKDKGGQADIHFLLTFQVTGQTSEVTFKYCLYKSQ